MRTEARVALVIVAVVVVAAFVYFGIGDREPIFSARPTADTPDDTLTVDTTAPPLEGQPAERSPIAAVDLRENGTRASINLDLAPTTTAPTTASATRPATERIRLAGEDDTPDLAVRANEPARVQIDLTQPPAGQPRTHVVRSGDTLYGIAHKYYGRGELWVEIKRANPRLVDPSRLRVGQKLTIPVDRQAVAHYEGLPAGADPAKYLRYKVKRGETFSSIAAKHLGSSTRWRDVYALNKSRVAGNPKNLRAGQTILIPR